MAVAEVAVAAGAASAGRLTAPDAVVRAAPATPVAAAVCAAAGAGDAAKIGNAAKIGSATRTAMARHPDFR